MDVTEIRKGAEQVAFDARCRHFDCMASCTRAAISYIFSQIETVTWKEN